jgi:DNA-binding CsgD family transcriptional regulator
VIVRRRADQGAGHDSPGGPGVGLGGRRTANATPEQAPLIVLSPTERRVFELFLRGHSLDQIAVARCISFYTARTHLEAVVRKFGVRSRVELLYVANQRVA